MSNALPVVLLDPRKIKLLRSEKNAVLKNDLMMLVLRSSGWYEEYAAALEAYRTRGAARPTYPTDRLERVEALVDELIVESVDPNHVR